LSYSNSWVNSTPAHPLVITVAPNAHDNLQICVVTDASATESFTWPSGFVQISNRPFGTDGSTLATAEKVDATGSETTLSISNTLSHAMIGGVVAHSGRNNTTGQDVTAIDVFNSTAQASPWTQAGTISPATDGCDIVAFFDSDTTGGTDPVHSFADTIPLTWTVRQDQNSGFYNWAFATAPQATHASTTVTGTGTLVAESAGRAMLVMALRPAAGGGATKTPYDWRPVMLPIMTR
jgi:hypothetical protein